jgi:hypothetical protein
MARSFRALTFLACLACAPVAHAQSASGHISGVITDEQGAPVPGVFVTAHGTDQSKRIQTGSDGQYLIHDLLAGRYVLTAARDGYTTVVRNGVMVRVGRTAAMPFVLKNVEADNAQPQAPAPAPARSSRFRGLNAGTVDGTLPSYNPIELLPLSAAVLVDQRVAQTLR